MDAGTQDAPTIVDNASQKQQGDDAASSQQQKDAPVKPDNASMTPEQLEDYKRKLHGSKEEALRLKQENETLEQKLKELELQKQAKETQADDDVPLDEEQIKLLKRAAKKAGLAFQEDIESLRTQEYKKQQQQALGSFLGKHPEYNKMGDLASDALWKVLEAEVSTYKSPQKGDEWALLLEKAHKVISSQEEASEKRGEALGYAKANLLEQATFGSSSGGVSSAPTVQKKMSKEQEDVFAEFAKTRPEYFAKK